MTLGKINVDVERQHFARFPRDRSICLPFLECFDITRAVRSRDELHSFVLVKVHDRAFGGFLGVDGDREILLVLCHGRELQQRDLAKLAEVPSRLQLGRRLEPRLRFIVSADDRTGELVRRHMTEYPEDPPIVGLSTAEVLATDGSDDWYRLISRRHFIHDYFALEAPLTQEAMFFGRRQHLAELEERITRGQNSGIFGLRRIGKTSILYALKRDLHSHRRGLAVYLDLSGSYNARWWTLLEELVLRVADDLSLGKARRNLQAGSEPYTEEGGSRFFQTDIAELCKRAPDGRICLLLDEIEYLSPQITPAEHWAKDFIPFWTAMRAAHQNAGGTLTYVLAGVNPTALEVATIDGADNPLFNTTRPYFVGPLDRESASRMVRTLARMMGLSVEKDFLNVLHEVFGCHPYLERRACSDLARHLESRPAVLRAEQIRADLAHLTSELRGPFEQIVSVLKTWYPYEYELLEVLAEGDTDTFKEWAKTDPSFARHVEGYGLVQHATSDPIIAVGVAREVLAGSAVAPSRLPAGQDEVDIDDDWDAILGEVSFRRNRIERALRSFARDVLLIKFGQRSFDQALAAIEGKRRERLTQLGYRGFWDDLYLNELLALISRHWEHFEVSMGLSPDKFTEYGRTINQGRIDAHARSCSAEELAYLRVCFDRLETALERAGRPVRRATA